MCNSTPPPPPRPSFELRAQPSTPAGCQSEFRHTPRRVDWPSLRPAGTLPQLAAGQRRAAVAARWGRTPNGKARSLARGRSQGSTEQCRPPPSAGASGRAGPQSKRIRWEGRACERPARQSWPSTAHTSRDVIGHQVQTPPLPLRARWSAPPSCPLWTWGGAAGRTVPASTPPSPGTPLLRIERNAHQCALRTHARAMVCGSAGHDHPRVWTVVWGGGEGKRGGGLFAVASASLAAPRPTGYHHHATGDRVDGAVLPGRDSCKPDSWASPPSRGAWDAMCGNWGGPREGVMPFVGHGGGGVGGGGARVGVGGRGGIGRRRSCVCVAPPPPPPPRPAGRARASLAATASGGVVALLAFVCSLPGCGRWEGGHAAPAASASAFRAPQHPPNPR